jgi:hypothetical protein
MSRNHVVISGTGRTGTTFLVQLLTVLGFDTGYNKSELDTDPISGAGLEWNILNDNAPYIVKSPWLCFKIEEVLARTDINIDHVFLPIRELFAAAESRRNVYKKSPSALPEDKKNEIDILGMPGGLWISEDPAQQEQVLLSQIYNLLFRLSSTNIPITLLNFPKSVFDPKYLYTKLNPIMSRIKYQEFDRAHNLVARPELVSEFG